MSHHLLAEIVTIIVAASVIAYISHRLRQLPIVGFLVAGIVIGPHAFGLVRDMELIEAVAEIGVILLLFTLGIEFSLDRLSRMKRLILIGGGIQVLVTIALTAAIGAAFDLPLRVGLFTGALLALSSTAIVLKVLAARGEQASEKGNVAVGILIFQDLAVILLVLLVPVIGGGGESTTEILVALGKAVGLILLVLVLASRLMPPILEAVARTCSPEIFILSVIGICLGLTWLTSLTGVSLSLGAFIAGLVVSESRFSHHALSEILPLQILFSAAFFVSVGMLLDLEFVAQRPLAITAIVLAILVIKIVTGALGAVALRLPVATTMSVAFLLAQVGEFSFVLERAGRAWGLSPAGRGEEGTQYFIAATVVLMALTPVLAAIGSRIERTRSTRGSSDAATADDGRALAGGSGPAGHVIIAGYGTGARYLARVLRDSGIPFVVVTLSPDGVTEVQRERDHVIAGDYARRTILEHAGIETAKVLVIPDDSVERSLQVVSVAKTLNPAVQVIVRTARLADVEELVEIGADQVVPEELEAAVELFGRVLGEYEIAPEARQRYQDAVRRDHYVGILDDSDRPVVVCDDLDPECLNRRTIRIVEGTAADGLRVRDLPDGLTLSALRRNGAAVEIAPGARLQRGDEVVIEAAPEILLRSLDLFRADSAIDRIELSEEQKRSPSCAHAAQTRRFLRPEAQCPACVAQGDRWVHLRICMTCGQVGCCESSKNKHALAHATSEKHPIVRSLEAGEEWAWCYEDETYL